MFQNDVVEVYLLDTSTERDVCINEQLVLQGHADKCYESRIHVSVVHSPRPRPRPETAADRHRALWRQLAGAPAAPDPRDTVHSSRLIKLLSRRSPACAADETGPGGPSAPADPAAPASRLHKLLHLHNALRPA